MMGTEHAAVEARVASRVVAQCDLLDQHWTLVGTPGCVEGPHRQRTAINRLRGLAGWITGEAGTTLRAEARHLRTWQRLLGPLRDLDITAQWIGAAGAPLATLLQEDRQAAELALRADLEGQPAWRARGAAAAFRAWAAPLVEAPRAPLDPPAVGLLLPPQLLTPWQEAAGSTQRYCSDKVLHSFRVLNKHVRDAVELLAEELGPEWKARGTLLQAVHRTTGNLQDLAVAVRWLSAARLRGITGDAGTVASSALAALREAEFTRLVEAWPGLIGLQRELPEAACRAGAVVATA